MKKVNIRFIFATTENFENTFLKTFLRRIPVAVTLPTLNKRPIEEKIALLINFFQAESNRIKKDIVIPRKIIEHLIFKKYSGNVGEMKTDIQFICAQNYLQQMNEETALIIDVTLLKEPLIDKDAKDMLNLNKLLQDDTITIKTGVDMGLGLAYLRQESYEDDMFYRFLLREYSNLKNSNIPETQAAFILEKKLEQLYDMQLFNEEAESNKSLMRQMDDGFTEKMEKVCVFIETEGSVVLTDQLKQIISKHLYATLLFINVSDDDFYEYSSQLMLGKLENYDTAEKIVRFISDQFNVTFPKTEITYFGLLLKKLNQEVNVSLKNKECGIVVIASLFLNS